MKLILRIELLSAMLPGSGNGLGSLINSDVVWDDTGIPFIPAKRVKGCLKDSALEVLDMISYHGNDYLTENDIEKVFGLPGKYEKSFITLNNLFIKEYRQNKEWLSYLSNLNDSIINVDKIKNEFTEIRISTSIDEKTGVAKEHSLRTIRYLKKGLIFEGELILDNPDFIKIVALACANFKTMGTQRTRGTGDVKCTIWEKKQDIVKKTIHELEVA